MTEQMAVLDAVYAEISTTIRGSGPDEPPFEINDGYTKLLFACGYHRLGNAKRAEELEAAGHALLAPHRDDPIHAWLLDAFAAWIRESPLPGALLERLDALDRIERYKVDRFREASWLLGGEEVDAIGRFGGRGSEDVSTTSARFLETVDRSISLAEDAEDQDLADAYIEMSLQVRPELITPEARRASTACCRGSRKWSIDEAWRTPGRSRSLSTRHRLGCRC